MVIAYGHFMSEQRRKGKLWKCKIKRVFSTEAAEQAAEKENRRINDNKMNNISIAS